MTSSTAPSSAAGATVSPEWVSQTAARTGVPEPAIRAYGTATILESREDPSCHLGWTTLAGLGWVESQQGTIDGRTLQADGRPSAPITGPALDGTGDVAAIEAPDGGWARALGPMQFLPSTWDLYGAGGDINDPHDAILAAARLLVANGAPGDMAGALYHYNPSSYYVRAVSAFARTMQRAPFAYRGYWQWRVLYRHKRGTYVLPVGYPRERPVPLRGG